ncbi:DUF2490 domain-containing protein [Adhaeribacter terreus]|uniref:DUF2490 domain-containing protein n=1 Tax=Adhaeribacter terreus TaxID=529703 RepID=A0ABW0E8N7_9BACT
MDQITAYQASETLLKMTKKLLLLLGLGFYLQGNIFAQAQKTHSEPMIWGDLQADYFLPNQSFFFFKTELRHNTNSYGLIEDINLYQVYFQLGYDQKLSDHWRAGGSARYTLDRRNNNQVYQAALQHNGKIGKTDFIKRISYDLMRFAESDGMGRLRPMVALERNFNFILGGRALRPHLSYELFFYNDFQSEDLQTETRTVDRTRLRAALSFQATERLWLTPFFIRQTEYYNVLPTYINEVDAAGNLVLDGDGNPVVVEKDPGGKRNRIEPILGLEIRWLLPGKNVSDRTIPGLGVLPEVN